MSPYPKADRDRKRRNAPTFDWVVLPADGRPGRAPRLPECPPSLGKWSAHSQRRWRHIWGLPQATQWEEGSETLARWLLLVELLWREPAHAHRWVQELRQLEEAHGMTPASMNRLRWKVAPTSVRSRETGAPGRSASKARWVAWAVECGVPEDVARSLSVAELRDRTGAGSAGGSVSVLDRYRGGSPSAG